jgi:hypothetical protein
MSLPIFQQQTNQPFMLMQNNWASQLNPVLGNPITNPTLIFNIQLTTGVNVINHKLGTTPVGWFICDLTAPITVYRSAPFNNLTLSLTSSGSGSISIGVF